MTFEEALKELKNRKKIRRKGWSNKNYCIYKRGNGISDCNGIQIIDNIFFDDWEVVCENILDNEEKKYLGFFIRPFRHKVTCIKKCRYGDGEYIFIELNGEVGINLPWFKKDTMYKGMEAGKQYTLKELGL